MGVDEISYEVRVSVYVRRACVLLYAAFSLGIMNTWVDPHFVFSCCLHQFLIQMLCNSTGLFISFIHSEFLSIHFGAINLNVFHLRFLLSDALNVSTSMSFDSNIFSSVERCTENLWICLLMFSIENYTEKCRSPL